MAARIGRRAVDRVRDVLIAYPGAGAVALVWWIAAYAVVLGLVLVALGFRARGLAHAVA